MKFSAVKLDVDDREYTIADIKRLELNLYKKDTLLYLCKKELLDLMNNNKIDSDDLNRLDMIVTKINMTRGS